MNIQSSKKKYILEKKMIKETCLKIMRKHILNMDNLYKHDEEAHQKGTCSYPLTAICIYEEHKWIYGIKEMAERLMRDIENEIDIKLCGIYKDEKEKPQTNLS